MIDATACGCDTYTAWLPRTSITVDPARLDMAVERPAESSCRRRDEIPARLRFPRGLRDCAGGCVDAPGHLRIGHEGMTDENHRTRVRRWSAFVTATSSASDSVGFFNDCDTHSEFRRGSDA